MHTVQSHYELPYLSLFSQQIPAWWWWLSATLPVPDALPASHRPKGGTHQQSGRTALSTLFNISLFITQKGLFKKNKKATISKIFSQGRAKTSQILLATAGKAQSQADHRQAELTMGGNHHCGINAHPYEGLCEKRVTRFPI